LNTIFPALFISVVNIWVSEELIIKWPLQANWSKFSFRFNVKFPVIFTFMIKLKMSSYFINYVDLEMTLVFDSGIKVIGWPFWLLQLLSELFPCRKLFLATYCIIENRKILNWPLEVDPWINYLFEYKNFCIFYFWSQKNRFLSKKNYYCWFWNDLTAMKL